MVNDRFGFPWHSIDNALRFGVACELAYLRIITTVQQSSGVTEREVRRMTGITLQTVRGKNLMSTRTCRPTALAFLPLLP